MSLPSSNTQEFKPSEALLYDTRSEDVQEIMGRMPSWLVRYGILLVGGILILLFTGSYFLRYPDKVQTQLIITSNNPPVKVIAEQSGRIRRVMVSQNQLVEKGSTLLEIDNLTRHEDVEALKMELIQAMQQEYTLQRLQKKAYSLGELQTPYLELMSTIEEWNYFLSTDNSHLSIGQLEKQIEENIKLTHQLTQNQGKIRENAGIDKQLYEMDKILFSKNALTKEAYLMSKKKWLDQQMNLNANQNTIANNSIKLSELRKSILDLKQQRSKALYEYKHKTELQVRNLYQLLENWQRTNSVISPIKGQANLYSVWKENQYVKSGQPILVVVPTYQDIVVKGYLPLHSSAKVKVGQKVWISLMSHPSAEYGFLEGKVSFIASAPLDSVYSFEVILPKGFVTSTNQVLFQQPEMFGTGEIVTDDKSVLQRLVEKFKIRN